MKQGIRLSLAFLIAVAVGSVACGQALIYEYDAGQDPDGGTDALWQHNINNSAVHGGPFNRDFSLSNVAFNPTPNTNYSGITAAYTFNGTNSSADTTNSATTNDRSFGNGDFPLGGGLNNAAGASATIEVWLRPSASSLSDVGDQMIFESGGTTNGLHLAFLDQPAGGVDLQFRTRENSVNSDVTFNLTDPALLDDFMQIVGVIDPNNAGDDDMRLFVNGVEVASVDNWEPWQDGNDNAGLGSVGAGGSSALTAVTAPFAGDIALLRLYDGALTNDEIAALFAAGSLQVPEPSSIAIWSLLGLISCALAYRRIRSKAT